MNLELQDRVVLITGGAAGIGEAAVRAFAAEGAIVWFADRNAERGRALAAEVPRSVFAEGDLADPLFCAELISSVLREAGRLDVLVNNAGVNDGVPLTGSPADFMASLRRNLLHVFALAHHAQEALCRSRGCILNISSKVAETGQGGTSAYAAANGGRNALTREWAVELLGDEIRVNAVIVAECWTPLYEKWINTLSDPQETLARIEARIPLGKRMTSSEEIANAVAFLLSPRSSHTTGQLLHIDGGYTHLDRALA